MGGAIGNVKGFIVSGPVEIACVRCYILPVMIYVAQDS